MSSENPIKQGLRNIGSAIDSGISSVMREVGANVRVECPSCHQLSQAPPNEDVKCPKCMFEFRSASATQRAGAIGTQLKESTKKTWEAHKQKSDDPAAKTKGEGTLAEKGGDRGA